MSKRVFIDTNVMLDFLGERKPFYTSIAKIATMGEKGELALVVSPISFATVNYFLSKFESSKIASEKLRKFKIISEICSLDGQTIEKGLNSSFKDFEDALQNYSAEASGSISTIITRKIKDYKHSQLAVMTPELFLRSSY